MANKTNILMVFLILVIVVLAAIVLYAFVIGPAYTGFIVEKQTEGAQYGAQITIESILTQWQQNNGIVQIPIGVDADGNQQAITLVDPSLCPSLGAAPAQPVQ